MSCASLAHARHTPHRRNRPDAIRIAAISAAMALNLAVILIATRPVGAPPLAATTIEPQVAQLRLITAPAVVPPPPAIVLKPLPHPPRTLPHSQPRTTTVIVPKVATTTEQQIVTPPTAVNTIAPDPKTSVVPATTAPVEASLTYRSAPLQFPVQAMRQQMQGTVLLRVLVDETGKPIDVVIEHSSGHALLDRSAREQVLASWKFQPAMVNGKAVSAWARVPVSFDLHPQ